MCLTAVTLYSSSEGWGPSIVQLSHDVSTSQHSFSIAALFMNIWKVGQRWVDGKEKSGLHDLLCFKTKVGGLLYEFKTLPKVVNKGQNMKVVAMVYRMSYTARDGSVHANQTTRTV